ncbi:MAG: sulfotransferase [Anaerolineae bacterium]|nr:sulfotransferase [Anaerolineae bacterium]
MTLITVIGRGHSGTRAMSHTLSASGVYMGEPLNKSGDLLPPEAMYEACRVFARHVHWWGGVEWDWSEALAMEPPAEFTDLIYAYLQTVLESPAAHRGWKIPETTLCYPWIQRMFPEARYIHWFRDPRDNIVGRHKTDDLHDFGIDYPETENERLRRAYSWIYQYKLVQATPKPHYWTEVRFEDFVLQQEQTLARLEAFLGIELATIPVRVEPIGRWRTDPGPYLFEFLEPALQAYRYADPAYTAALPPVEMDETGIASGQGE